MSFSISKTPAVATHRAMLSHTSWVEGVAHLPERRQIITCAVHDSLRLWDVESGAQIGEDWRDGNDLLTGVRSMALSPNGKMIVSGSRDNHNVRVWNVEARKVIAKWEGHTKFVGALSWSADSKQVLSGSWDGTTRAWDVKSAKTVLAIKTGHEVVQVAIYSPDATKIATGGLNENAVKIWDTKTGELLKTLKHDHQVYSLAWTLEGKKLISGSFDPIRIFDTVTWEEIAILKGHADWINAISLSQNERVLASASGTRVHLWNLDTNLQVGPLIQHENEVRCAALSADGKLLVTGCEDENAYTWDVHAMLKEAGLEDLLKPIYNVPVQKSLMNSNATRRPPIQARQIPAGFFDGVQNGTQSSTVRGTHPRSPVHHSRSTRTILLERISSLFHHSYRNTDDANELQQRQSRSIFSRGPPIVEVAAVKDRGYIYCSTAATKNTAVNPVARTGVIHDTACSRY